MWPVRITQCRYGTTTPELGRTWTNMNEQASSGTRPGSGHEPLPLVVTGLTLQSTPGGAGYDSHAGALVGPSKSRAGMSSIQPISSSVLPWKQAGCVAWYVATVMRASAGQLTARVGGVASRTDGSKKALPQSGVR